MGPELSRCWWSGEEIKRWMGAQELSSPWKKKVLKLSPVAQKLNNYEWFKNAPSTKHRNISVNVRLKKFLCAVVTSVLFMVREATWCVGHLREMSVCSFITYLLSTYYVLSSVLGSENPKQHLPSQDLQSRWGGRPDMQISVAQRSRGKKSISRRV